MKLNHTLLSAVASKKKLLLGALALTLVGGTAPALVNKTHAAAPIQTMYTTVGPAYYTTTDFADDSGLSYRIADTSVADFFDAGGGKKGVAPAGVEAYPISERACYVSIYGCIQGKKIGSTEIIVERDGEEISHIPLVSVELFPRASSFINAGETITGTGSIKGADNNLLKLVSASSYYDDIVAAKTGDRSFTIATTSDNYHFLAAELSWQIGNQRVGGGTNYLSFPVKATDNIFHSAENEAKLAAIAFQILATTFDASSYEGGPITLEDGSIFIPIQRDPILVGDRSTLEITLDLEETTPAEDFKDELTSGFLDGTKGIKFAQTKADLTLCTINSGPVERSVSSDDTECYLIGTYTQLGQELDMTLSVENVAGVKAGYARKWYVTRDNNGVIERLEATYDEETGTIHFKSNGLGFYAYGYVDEKINNVPGVPNTGARPMQQIATAVATVMPITAVIIFGSVLAIKKRAAKKMAKKFNHFD